MNNASKKVTKQLGSHSARGSKPSAFKRFQEQVKWVDLIVEVLDARAPFSSRHPKSEKIFAGKPRLVILSKLDLADLGLSQKWVQYLNNETEQRALALSIKDRASKNQLLSLARALTKDKQEASSKKGLKVRPLRICVVGMPNVGKSSLINWLVGQKHLKVANRPGITKAPQWLRVDQEIELLDTPGVLPITSFDELTTLKLALINVLNEGTYDVERAAQRAIPLLSVNYADRLQNYFSTKEPVLEDLALKRKFLSTGGELDLRRAAQAFLVDLREGKLGRLMLDQVPSD